jgi:hypothetical protein
MANLNRNFTGMIYEKSSKIPHFILIHHPIWPSQDIAVSDRLLYKIFSETTRPKKYSSFHFLS